MSRRSCHCSAFDELRAQRGKTTEPRLAVVRLLSRSSSRFMHRRVRLACIFCAHLLLWSKVYTIRVICLIPSSHYESLHYGSGSSFSLLFFHTPSLTFARKLCRCVNPQRQFFRTWVGNGIHCWFYFNVLILLPQQHDHVITSFGRRY